MRPWSWLTVLSLLLVAHASQALPITQEIPLSPDLEVAGPPELADSPASGVAVVTFDPANPDAGIQFVLNLVDINTPLTQGHIHLAPPGVNGPIAVDFFGFINTPSLIFGPLVVLPGNAILRSTQGFTWEQVIAAIVDGAAYVNVHTQQFQGGEIRGNFPGVIPEPALLVLLGVSLSLLALRRRSRARS